MAEKNIKIVERKINPEELGNFVGCFLTGTAAEVTPVASIDKYKFKVCNTIIELSDSYQEFVRKKERLPVSCGKIHHILMFRAAFPPF